MNFKKFEVYGNPTLQQGGWIRTGEGNNYLRYTEPSETNHYNRICTLEYVPQHHPNHITITGIASKELDVSVLVLRSDNYIIASLGWQDNGYTFNLGSTYDKLGVMFRFKNGDTITPNQVSFDIVVGWNNTPHYIHNTSTDTITTLPAVLYPNDTTATVGMKGNTTQSGTPTPADPITPQGTGERTGNLFDYVTMSNGGSGYLKVDGSVSSSSSWAHTDYIPCDNSSFVLSKVGGNAAAICFYDATKTFIYGQEYNTGGANKLKDIYCTVPQTAKYIRFTYNVSGSTAIDLSTIMLNEGSTAPSSYIPPGYKIPISSNSTTTPVYLGEVETTRKIGKYVFTGEENIRDIGDYYNTNVSVLSVAWGTTTSTTGGFQINNSGNRIWAIKSYFSSYATAADFKTYLAQQYANGTPVCVWYVLATPTTGIVNEPLMKIGDYADEVSGITIPVTAGTNTLSIDTTLQPSEVTVNYKGWHPVQSVHERENGAWD